MSDMPSIDRQKCDNCGLCVEVCGCHALVMVGGVLTIVHTENCHWCTICEAICPKGALTCPFDIVIEG